MPQLAVEAGGARLELRSVVRARRVLEKMKEKDMFRSMEDEDVNFLKGLPTMLMQNGLGQTLAFLAIKNNRKIFELLSDLVFSHVEVENTSDTMAVMDCVTGLGEQQYIEKQQEAMRCAAWMKKFAVAFHHKSQKGE